MHFQKGNIPWNKGKKLYKKVSDKTRKKLSRALSGKKNPMYGKKGYLNPNWKGGKYIHKKGYVYAYVGDGKYIPRSHIVWSESMSGASLPKGAQIHHKDLDRTNDLPENLSALSSSDHAKLHWRLKKNILGFYLQGTA